MSVKTVFGRSLMFSLASDQTILDNVIVNNHLAISFSATSLLWHCVFHANSTCSGQVTFTVGLEASEMCFSLGVYMPSNMCHSLGIAVSPVPKRSAQSSRGVRAPIRASVPSPRGRATGGKRDHTTIPHA